MDGCKNAVGSGSNLDYRAQIDWKKPIRLVRSSEVFDAKYIGRTPFGFSATRHAVEWNYGENKWIVFTDDRGFVPDGFDYHVENVPPEPNDHLSLYRSGDRWHINAAGSLGPNQESPRQLQPKSYWEKTALTFPGGVVVKVPV